MKAIQSVTITICLTCVATAIISVLIPQKRTRRIMSFVLGLFFISTFLSSVITEWNSAEITLPKADVSELSSYDESKYRDTVAQLTADHLTDALNDLLNNEGITPKDIRLSLKISDEGRITVVRAVIYISDDDVMQIEKIKDIVYRNIAKEPEVYVQQEETQ